MPHLGCLLIVGGSLVFSIEVASILNNAPSRYSGTICVFGITCIAKSNPFGRMFVLRDFSHVEMAYKNFDVCYIY